MLINWFIKKKKTKQKNKNSLQKSIKSEQIDLDLSSDSIYSNENETNTAKFEGFDRIQRRRDKTGGSRTMIWNKTQKHKQNIRKHVGQRHC